MASLIIFNDLFYIIFSERLEALQEYIHQLHDIKWFFFFFSFNYDFFFNICN